MLIGNHAIRGMPFRTLYISASDSVSTPKSVNIKGIVESPGYNDVFPKVTKGELWNKGYWGLDFVKLGIPFKEASDEGYTMFAAGIQGSIPGKRCEFTIFDDLMKSVADVAAADTRTKMVTTYSNSIRPCLVNGGRRLSLGTRYHPADILATTFVPENDWEIIRQQALLFHKVDCVDISKDPSNPKIIKSKTTKYSFWEKKHPLEKLLKDRNADPIAFAYQYQNETPVNTTLSLQRSSLILGSPIVDKNKVSSFYLGCDLATSLRTKSDYTVMLSAISLKTEPQTVIFLDYHRQKITGNMEKIAVIKRMFSDWIDYSKLNSKRLVIESNGYQLSLRGDREEHGYNDVSVICLPRTKGDKLQYFSGVRGWFENGRIIFNQYVDWKPFFDELTGIGATAHDDCLDVAVNVILGVKRYPPLTTA